MYLVTISDRVNNVEIKSKKALKTLLEAVCPPLGLKYTSIEWVIEKMKLNSRIKLQNGKRYLWIVPSKAVEKEK